MRQWTSDSVGQFRVPITWSQTLGPWQVWIWHYILIFISVLLYALHKNWFFKKYVWVFLHFGVGKMCIYIEIIFSELYFRVCQIYKYHYYKDIFLDIDFLLSVFLLSFIMSGSPHTAFMRLGFCFWAISLPRLCFWWLKSHTVFYLIFLTLQFQNKIIPLKGCLKVPSVEGTACGHILPLFLFHSPHSSLHNLSLKMLGFNRQGRAHKPDGFSSHLWKCRGSAKH
jgi:hypothetical protein